jgi:hypothetical protein
MIIETSANRFYEVFENVSPELAHVWRGEEVKRDRKTGEWKYTKARRSELVRKAASRIVEA